MVKNKKSWGHFYGAFDLMDSICDVLRDLVPFEQFKNVKNTHGEVLLSVKLQAKTCNFTKSNTPPWVFFMFFRLYKWYQIAQRISYELNKNELHAPYHIAVQRYVSYRNQSFVFLCKTNDWFLYKTQLWAKMG